MRFQLTDDQRALRRGTRELFEARFDRAALRRAVDHGGLDRTLWRTLGEAGLFALRLPEADGGVGLGLPEAVLAFEEAGRVLLPGPLVATHLAAGEIPGAATGETVVTAAYGGLVEWLEEADVVRGLEEADVVRGLEEADVVRELDAADLVRELDAADAVRGLDAADAVRGAGAVAGPVPLESVDPLTPLHRSTPPARAVPAGPADPVVVLLTAAEQLGGAARTCELAVQHARAREQFGRPIGAFQAVKHLCAEMLVRVETARAAVYAAAVTADPLDAAAARLLADDAAVRGARDCLQVHGGMGFTWDSEVHLHLKRAWVRTRRTGDVTHSEELLAGNLLSATAP
ncbi:acyl-CoA dehydrogenase family protein [Streptomyces sp. NPDC059785]|uniref:acyl-CoA dehydrogenase family protein n=1 Tax=Streptomyces sp. NPDC059785 TaxID=3346945 RepID=UPI003656BF4B